MILSSQATQALQSLRREAAAAGDYDTVADTTLALRGQKKAYNRCLGAVLRTRIEAGACDVGPDGRTYYHAFGAYHLERDARRLAGLLQRKRTIKVGK